MAFMLLFFYFPLQNLLISNPKFMNPIKENFLSIKVLLLLLLLWVTFITFNIGVTVASNTNFSK